MVNDEYPSNHLKLQLNDQLINKDNYYIILVKLYHLHIHLVEKNAGKLRDENLHRIK